jgi:hypothetical protein
MIQIYRKKLYDDWYSSLTDEQKQRLEEYEKEEAEKRRRNAEMALARLGWLYSFMNRATHGKMDEYMECARLVNKMSNHPSKYW